MIAVFSLLLMYVASHWILPISADINLDYSNDCGNPWEISKDSNRRWWRWELNQKLPHSFSPSTGFCFFVFMNSQASPCTSAVRRPCSRRLPSHPALVHLFYRGQNLNSVIPLPHKTSCFFLPNYLFYEWLLYTTRFFMST